MLFYANYSDIFLPAQDLHAILSSEQGFSPFSFSFAALFSIRIASLQTWTHRPVLLRLFPFREGRFSDLPKKFQLSGKLRQPLKIKNIAKQRREES